MCPLRASCGSCCRRQGAESRQPVQRQVEAGGAAAVADVSQLAAEADLQVRCAQPGRRRCGVGWRWRGCAPPSRRSPLASNTPLALPSSSRICSTAASGADLCLMSRRCLRQGGGERACPAAHEAAGAKTRLTGVHRLVEQHEDRAGGTRTQHAARNTCCAQRRL